MKANSINSVRQINPSFIKSIIILFILVLPILKGFSQEKINIGKIDEKIIGSWVVPANGILTQNFSFEMDKNEKIKIPFYFQYTFLQNGTFTKSIIILGQYGEFPLVKNNFCTKGTWFTLNNQIYLTENCKVSSLTYSITKETLSIKGLSNSSELTAIN
ncbi:MAG: hypothetical protein IPQ19_09670 [Bacteroidetes bacterium]|nr:hypothetical protein [Bacteroidota bacterium]